MPENPHIVSPEWLEARLHEPGVSIVDAAWYLPAQGRNAQAEYEQGHIPGAVFFDQDLVVDPESDLPHTLPPPAVFEQFANSMGISADDTIIVHDGPGFFTAPRVWWMFRVMGAKDVRLLEGGLDGWKAAGRETTNEPTKIAPTHFEVSFNESRVASLEDVRDAVESGTAQIADARPPGRFTGADKEPRDGIRSGHMPGAHNVPALALSKDGKLLPASELRAVFESAGVDLSKPVMTSCGSGVTAAVISLALDAVGHTDHRLYDGSWTEWGGLPDTPVVTGKA